MSSVGLDRGKNYLLLFLSHSDCGYCFEGMTPVWNSIDEFEGIEVVGIFYNVDDRLVDYLRDRYGFRFRVLSLRGKSPFVWTPVEVLVDGFGRVYYKVESVRPTRAHITKLMSAVKKFLKQNNGGKYEKGQRDILMVLIVLSLLFALVHNSSGQSAPTRIYNFTAGRCEPTPIDCFDDVVVEPPK